MITPEEYLQWQKERYSTVEKACYGIVRDRRGFLRPNAKDLVRSLMACIGTYGPTGWGLSLEEACRIGIREANSECAYQDIWLRAQGLLT